MINNFRRSATVGHDNSSQYDKPHLTISEKPRGGYVVALPKAGSGVSFPELSGDEVKAIKDILSYSFTNPNVLTIAISIMQNLPQDKLHEVVHTFDEMID